MLGVGVNLTEIAFYAPPPFIDRMKSSGTWGAYPGTSDTVPLDANGYPTAIPPTNGNYFISTLFAGDDGSVTPVDYVIRHDGDMDIQINGASRRDDAHGGQVWRWSGSSLHPTLMITGIRRAATSITIIRVDQVDLYDAGHRIDPMLVEQTKGMPALRLMDWMRTNDSMVVDALPPVGAATYTNGAPIEVAVWLARETGARPWITLPMHASDALVQRVFQTLKDGLPEGTKPIVELSNEVWNEDFEQAQYAQEQAAAMGVNRPGFYGFRAGRIAVLGRAYGFKVALMWQMGADFDWPAIFDGATRAGATDADFEAVGAAGYLNGTLADATGPTLALAAAKDVAGGVANIRSNPTGNSLVTMPPRYQGIASIARAHGCAFMVYEANLHLNTLPNFANDKAEVVSYFQSIVDAPEAAGLMTDNLKALDAAGCSIACLYNLAQPVSEWGIFGLYGTPGWDAVQAWKGNEPAPTPEPEPTPQLSIKARLAALEVKIDQLMKEKAA